MVCALLIPKYFNINGTVPHSSEITAGFLSTTNRWQLRRALFPLCQLGRKHTCHHLKHQSLPPLHRRFLNTTNMIPGCQLTVILKSIQKRCLLITPELKKYEDSITSYCNYRNTVIFHCSSTEGFRQNLPDFARFSQFC